MIFVAAIDTQEFRLCLPIVFRYMTAARASATGVVWRHGQQYAAIPRQLVVQLPPELAPALIKNGTVQTGLLLHPLAVLFVAAPGRPGHIPYLQILNADERVVLADRRGGFVQEVFPGIRDDGVNLLNVGFRLFSKTAHGALLFAVLHQFKFKGLKSLHESIILWTMSDDNNGKDGFTRRAYIPALNDGVLRANPINSLIHLILDCTCSVIKY